MTDLIERTEKALEDYEKNKKEWRHGFARELFATPALTLLPEAIEEIKRLRELLADIQSSQTYTYYGKDWKPVLARDLEDRAEAAEAKLAVAVEALEDALNRMEEDRASGDCGNWDWVDGDVYSRGRAALAEIKGEK